MPEIAEVARTVHFIRKKLVDRTLTRVTAADDANVYGKVGTSGAEFQKHMTGKKVVDAGQQGKYFWMIMSSPPHPVMHFGMSGWLKYKDEHSYYYRKKSGEKDEWPPKFVKFLLEATDEKGDTVEAAFVDMRRFGRIRLVDCPADQIRNVTPLKENGPDPVVDKQVVTVEWLKAKCRAKKVPIKAMLLDQAIISGIGNWVGDEVMFQARMHPEQYANTLSDDQIKTLHEKIHYVCQTSVDVLGDSEQFPEGWLFKHRWAKGKKDADKALPTGEKIAFLTVGGRTSCVVPELQKKTGPVAKEMSEAEIVDGASEEEKPKQTKNKKRKVEDDEEDDEEEFTPKKKAPGKKATTGQKDAGIKDEKKPKQSKNTKKDAVKEEMPEVEKPLTNGESKGKAKKTAEKLPDRVKASATSRGKAAKADDQVDSGRRRSGRLTRG